jgi:2-polyprenyl-3-methyl-5-hydroxy-6-metoxy-1,4-benzoquinol methylase
VTYRERIYENYASNFQDLSPVFDAALSHRWGRAYDHYLRGWLPNAKDAAIVDVACGGGKLLHFFKERGYSNVQGVDLSPEQGQIARQVVPMVHEENTIDFLERSRASFDLITGLDVIEHLHKPEVLRFLDAAHDALKPGGRLVLQTPKVCFNPNALSRLMHLVGFKDIEPREAGPVPWGHSLTSSLRAGVWQMYRIVFKIWNLAETGSAGSGIFTRVFLISGMNR